MTNNFSKKGVFSRISGLADDFFLSILKLEGVEADEFEGDESDIERICVLLMFFGCCCDDVSMADSNKFSWIIYKTICISNNFRNSKVDLAMVKNDQIFKVSQHAASKRCLRVVFMWSSVLGCLLSLQVFF